MESWILRVSCKVSGLRVNFARDLKYSRFQEHSKNGIFLLYSNDIKLSIF